ncbi:MAG: hypothetical protein HRT77_07100 [Halioglobus sp.]|nr:hypothetical protein [Halioglobus sp.]
MSDRIKRVRRLMPTIILTVLSMIQALALELYWSQLVEAEYLWAGDWIALIGWLQFAAMFFGILLIWLLYVSFVLRFNWLPSLEDTLVPFLIGLMEFGLIGLTHPDLIGPWMMLLAALFVVAVFISHTITRRARQDISNAYFFSQFDPAGIRDYRESAITAIGMASFGAILWRYPQLQMLAALALLLTMAALGYQYLQARRFWLHSLEVNH